MRVTAQSPEHPEPSPASQPSCPSRGIDAARAPGAGAEVGVALALIVAAHAAATAAPGMWAWGLDSGRFLPPAIAWGGWIVMALALARPLAGAAAGALPRVMSHRPARALAWVAGALVPAATVLLLSDRTWFVSDFILRLGTILGATKASRLFPQALPLDLLLHVDLPRALSRALSWDVLTTERILGALKAGVLGLLGVALARELRARGAVALAVYALVAWGGWLQLLTGYGKATADLPVIVVAIGVFGLREVRRGNGAAGVAIAGAVGLLLHRSAVALVPAVMVAAALGARARAERRRDERLRGWAWYAVPAAVALALVPRLAALATGYDRAHLMPSEGLLRAAFEPGHLLDLVNLIAQLSPLALAVPVLVWCVGRDLAEREPHAQPQRLASRGRAEAAFVAAIAAPWVIEMLFVHPHEQGIVRDWDTFAAAGSALGIATAWALAERLGQGASQAWLGITVTAVALVPTLHQLALNHDVLAGTARVEAFVAGPPRRPDPHRALALDYLGSRFRNLGDLDAAAGAYRRAAEISPGARVLYNWALAEGERGHFRESSALLERLLATHPPTAQAWYTLAAVRTLQGDSARARAAVERSLELMPDGREALVLRSRLAAGSAAGARPSRAVPSAGR